MLENCHDIEIYMAYESKQYRGVTYLKHPDHMLQALCGLDSVMEL